MLRGRGKLTSATSPPRAQASATARLRRQQVVYLEVLGAILLNPCRVCGKKKASSYAPRKYDASASASAPYNTRRSLPTAPTIVHRRKRAAGVHVAEQGRNRIISARRGRVRVGTNALNCPLARFRLFADCLSNRSACWPRKPSSSTAQVTDDDIQRPPAPAQSDTLPAAITLAVRANAARKISCRKRSQFVGATLLLQPASLDVREEAAAVNHSDMSRLPSISCSIHSMRLSAFIRVHPCCITPLTLLSPSTTAGETPSSSPTAALSFKLNSSNVERLRKSRKRLKT